MPTNKLWIEHTEKAAWESVQALRDKIAEAERRIERLGPPVAAWQPLLDELDRLRSELGLGDESYVDVLRAVLERAASDRARVSVLERERVEQSVREREREQQALPREQPFDVTELMRHRGHESFDDDVDVDDGDRQPPSRGVSQRDLDCRRRELLADRALPNDVDALLRLIDTKVADLGDVEGQALADAALDLGVFALALAALREDEEE
jgi:hypothetical protein